MKILVFGSTNIDHNYRLDHIARPKETITSRSYEIHAGGKGLNQSIAFAKTGSHVYFAGMVGNDAAMLMKTMQDYGVDTAYVRQLDAPNGHAIIQIDDNGENSIFLYPGTNNAITADYVDEVLASFGKGDFLILQNEINMLDYIIETASRKEMVILMNPSPCDESLKKLPLDKIDYFFINEVEGELLTGKQDPQEMLKSMLELYPKSKTVLTLGSDGAYYNDCTYSCYQPAIRVKAIDTVGAGDTFMGYFSYGLSKGYTPEQCLLLGTKAASITVTRLGAAASIPTLAEINEKYPD